MSDLVHPSIPDLSEIEDDDAMIQRIIARDYSYTRVMQYFIDTGADSAFFNDASILDSA